MRKKLSKVALYTWRETKAAMTRKYKKFNDVFYLKPRHVHNRQWICDRILEDPSITLKTNQQ